MASNGVKINKQHFTHIVLMEDLRRKGWGESYNLNKKIAIRVYW